MIQTHVINHPRPWRLFFDSYGHLHLHAASMICVEENPVEKDNIINHRFGDTLCSSRVEFYTYPVNSIGLVITEVNTSMYHYLDIHEGEELTFLSSKFAENYQKILAEVFIEMPIQTFIHELNKCGVNLKSEESELTWTVDFHATEEEILDAKDKSRSDFTQSSLYYCSSENLHIIKGYDKVESFEETRQRYLDYLSGELEICRAYAPYLKLAFRNCANNIPDSFIKALQLVFDEFNSSKA